MPNIMVTDACNLRCPYCFANEFVNVSRNEISDAAFSAALDFILGDGSETVVGIIGGEPTLHPRFDGLMRKALLDDRAKGVMLYTNGLLLHEHWDVCCHAKTHMLINCNPPEQIGEKRFGRLCENLDTLVFQKMCRDRVTLGVNMYAPDQNYDYMLSLLKQYGFRHERVSVTVPNLEGQRNTDAHACFMRMKPSVLRFFHALLSEGIIPNFDCNKIPSCLLEQAEIEGFYPYLSDPFIRENIGRSNISHRRVNCTPVVDIRPDLTAVRCFGLSADTKQPISGYRGIRDLKNYYLRTVDAHAWNTVYSPRCADCYDRLVMSCSGGCFAFRADGIRRMARYADALTEGRCE